MPSIRYLLEVVSVLVLFPAVIPASSIPPNAETAWVEHNSIFLSSSYDVFSKCSLSHRKSIYSKLDGEAQNRLWIAHWESYRSAHPYLTPEQNGILDSLIQYIGAPAGVQQNIDYEALTKAAFGPLEGRSILSVLGPDDEFEEDADGTLDKRGVSCGCSLQSDYCFLKICKRGSCEVSERKSCGLLWKYYCDGLCVGATESGMSTLPATTTTPTTSSANTRTT